MHTNMFPSYQQPRKIVTNEKEPMTTGAKTVTFIQLFICTGIIGTVILILVH
jgi:hypothetical protein